VFVRPNGTRIPEAAARRGSFRGNIGGLGERAADIAVANRAVGIAIDARTARCRWLGEPLDYSLAIEGMQWRDARPAAPA
jgi:hypothetical protein